MITLNISYYLYNDNTERSHLHQCKKILPQQAFVQCAKCVQSNDYMILIVTWESNIVKLEPFQQLSQAVSHVPAVNNQILVRWVNNINNKTTVKLPEK